MYRGVLLAAIGMVAALDGVAADEVGDKAREVMNARKSCVVTLQLVLKEKFGMAGMASQENESTAEASGTVISEDGLTVLSLFKTDSTALMEAIMPNMGGSEDMTMSTEIEDVKFLLEDGTEIPAEAVLRDKELDMIFIRPKTKPEQKFEYLDLSENSTPGVLDHVVRLNRLGKVSGRAHSASVSRIEAVVERPRTYFVPENAQNDLSHLGAPAFTLDGKVVGVTFLRLMKSTGGMGGMGGMMGGLQDVLTTVILPAADIAESAGQVPPFE